MKYSLARLLIVLASISPALYGNVLQLEKDFKNPPHSAKPLTWMHFMSGNISRDGITKDLEAIADAGIGGIILFNVTHQIPNGPVQFNSPEHIALTAHAAAECERLGLSFGIHNCDGWTSSGGPWVPVEHSMKQVVYRETVIDGGQIDLILPGPTQRGGFYRDIAVLAYPALQPEVVDAGSRPIITSSDPGFDINIATNGKVDELTELTLSDGEEAWIQWDFGKPQTVRAFYLNTEKQRGNAQRMAWISRISRRCGCIATVNTNTPLTRPLRRLTRATSALSPGRPWTSQRCAWAAPPALKT